MNPTDTLEWSGLKLDGNTAVLGIIGDPVAQVKAPLPLTQLLQRRGINALLVPLHVPAAGVAPLLQALRAVRNVAGIVVTVPHKQRVAGLPIDTLRAAREAQAVNVVRRMGDGWQGDLLDGAGFLAGLVRNGFDVKGRSVGLAGAGGAGNAIAFALAAAGAASIDVRDADAGKRADLVERLRALGYTAGEWDAASPRDLLVNATPAGMREGDALPIAPEAVSCFVSLTVIPTEEMWKRAGMAFGMKAFHWYLFAQPFDLPERMLAAEPAYYLDWTLRNMVQKVDAVTPEALAEYHRAFAKASVRHAMVEDYRAAADIDLRHDRDDLAAGRRVACPVQVLWSASNTAKPDPLDIWKTWANEVEGGTIDCGHLMAEEAPDEVLARVLPFLQRYAGG